MTAEPAPARGHTPGKWEARGDHIGVWHRYKSGVKGMVHFVALASVSIPRRRKEVRSYHDDVAEMTANARLIAAAPDLLAFVERAAEMPDSPTAWATLRAQATALLAEIRGAR